MIINVQLMGINVYVKRAKREIYCLNRIIINLSFACLWYADSQLVRSALPLALARTRQLATI